MSNTNHDFSTGVPTIPEKKQKEAYFFPSMIAAGVFALSAIFTVIAALMAFTDGSAAVALVGSTTVMLMSLGLYVLCSIGNKITNHLDGAAR